MNETLCLMARTRRPIYTYGPLIHNPQVVKLLEQRGVRATTNIEDARDGILVIRSHGIPPETRSAIRKAGVEFHDLTCPDVAKIQGIVKKHAAEGYEVIIVGDSKHAETIGLLGFAGERGRIVQTPEEVENLQHLGKVCVVAQSTQDMEVFGETVCRIRKRARECLVIDTICESTRQRQREVAELARQVEAMIIVGGKNSANTNRLADISRKAGTPTYHIEDEEELDTAEIRRYNLVGVTAGASTPNWILLRVVDKLRGIRKKSGFSPAATLKGILDVAVHTNFYLGIGAIAVTMLAMRLQGLDPFSWILPLLSFFYIFSVHTINQIMEIDEYRIKHPAKQKFLKRWHLPLIVAAAFSLVLCLGIIVASDMRPAAGITVLALLVLGLLYHIRIVPHPFLRIIRYERLRDIPGSKDLFTALAWATIATVVPFLNASKREFSMGVLLSFLLIGGLVFIRSLLLDMMDVEGDRMVGRETIPVLLGKEGTKMMLGVIALSLGSGVILAIRGGWFPPNAHLLLIPVLYTCGYLYLYHKRIIEYGTGTDILIDGVFLTCGVVAFFI